MLGLEPRASHIADMLPALGHVTSPVTYLIESGTYFSLSSSQCPVRLILSSTFK